MNEIPVVEDSAFAAGERSEKLYSMSDIIDLQDPRALQLRPEAAITVTHCHRFPSLFHLHFDPLSDVLELRIHCDNP